MHADVATQINDAQSVDRAVGLPHEYEHADAVRGVFLNDIDAIHRVAAHARAAGHFISDPEAVGIPLSPLRDGVVVTHVQRIPIDRDEVRRGVDGLPALAAGFT